MSSNITWDKTADIIVLGSGAGAMTAAVTAAEKGAETLVLEKSHEIGGASAFSGGVPWIPVNQYMKEAGIKDTREMAIQYIRRLANGKEPNPALVEFYVDRATLMLDYLLEKTPLKFAIPQGYGDYYWNFEGGVQFGRSLDPVPFKLEALGEFSDKLRTNPTMPPLTLSEGGAGDQDGNDTAGLIADRLKNGVVTMGRALIGGLMKGALDHGATFELNMPAKKLIQDQSGRVIGVEIHKTDGTILKYGARQGVIVATGGFEWNKEMVKSFLLGVATHPLSPSSNEGDGHIMALEIGAGVANMQDAWWLPAMVDPTIQYEGREISVVGGGRGNAGSIMVNQGGKRFVNEGSAYVDIVKAFFTFNEASVDYPNKSPAWLIFDNKMKESHVIATVASNQPVPDWFYKGETIAELAGELKIDPATLEKTVARWNENSKALKDPDFHRGTLAFEVMINGTDDKKAMIGPLETAPYYAIPIYAGSLGTNGGIKINEHGQALTFHNEVIPGLYAAGNAAMSVLGGAYPGAGATIGPAMVFGHIGALHAVKEQKVDLK